MESLLLGCTWSAQVAVAWGMAGRLVEEAKGGGSRATIVREAIALAGEIVSKCQIAVQAQKGPCRMV
jgi:enoyl-CoA hydratase/carnithine racemase